jgi:hypothetical protein
MMRVEMIAGEPYNAWPNPVSFSATLGGAALGVRLGRGGVPADDARDRAEDCIDLGGVREGGERGKYAARYAAGTNLVPLDPDVAAAFPDPAEVNAVLRAVAGIIRGHTAGTKPDSKRRTA